MRRVTAWIFSVGFVLLSLSGYGQRLRSFTAEPQAYMDELTEFLNDMEDVRSDSVEVLMLRFQPAWTSFEESQRGKVYELSNQMLRKRLIQYEDWVNLLELLMYFNASEEIEEFDAWLSDATEFVRTNPNRVSADYFYNLRIALTKQFLYDDRSIRWEALNGEWEFVFEGKPLIRYTDIDLWGFFRVDSTLVEATSGVYDPQARTFTGQGGTVYWSRAGLSADTMYAELRNYTVDVSKTFFSADSVTLYSLLYIDRPIVGSYEERLTSQTMEERATFPRFVAYERLAIADFVPGVDYEGGFSVIGGSFYASDILPNTAKMKFKYEGKPLVELASERFLLRQKVISSDAARVTVHLGESDSLTHPKSQLKYLPEYGRMSLTRVDEGMSMTPYFDSFHDMSIYLEQITWTMSNPQIMIQNMNLGSVTPLVFESQNYYRGERFSALQGLSRVNPLYDLREVALARDTADQTLAQVARYLRMDEMNTHRFLMNMSIQGFVNYDINTRVASFNDKLFDYILNNEGKRDYDVIRFVSGVEQGANASISLLNYDMDIVGISAIALSDSQQVAMFPSGRKITVHEGLDFDFDGKIQAGRFSFWGQNHFFDYDMFRISMADIDSMRFMVEEFDDGTRLPGTRPNLVSVKNTLQDINGELLIDKPNNKSGKIRYTEYPIFKSGTESYVYYDNPSIYDGVYEREDFFVELEPFEIDSLDNTSTEGLIFGGVFVSAGIFPDMPQEVKVQEDYSLGFKTNTGPTGLPAYGGKGTFFNDLQLSNDGLVGTGTIDYLTSTAVGDAFTFFPDSTNGVARTYVVEERTAGPVEYPPTSGEDIFINWRPYDDVMNATTRSMPFNMYASDVGMLTTGTIMYGPNDMRGNAILDFLNAQTRSKEFVFYNRYFTAESMNFKVRKDAQSDWAFNMMDAHGTVDFNQQMGDFTLNGGRDYMNFTTNKYYAWMDHADWDIPAQTIEVMNENNSLSRMVSTRRSQDSLQFMARSAKFALAPSLLEAFEVPEIDVADSRVFPDTGYVAIDPNAEMRELTNAQLVANRSLKYHKFYNGTFKITSRHNYFGSADYEYLDKDGTAWPLYFEEIKVDTSETTVGLAQVKREDQFYLSSFFGYYGRVHLRAPERLMNYDGHLLIQHTCDNLETDWFRFESVIDPKDIVVDLPEDNPRTRGDDIYNGIYLAPDSTSIYSGFLNNDASRVDRELIAATGVLYYDEGMSSYIITPRERIRNPDANVNYVAFNNRDCILTGKGEISIAENTGRVSIQTYGVVEHDLRTDRMTIDASMLVDFHFSEDIMNAIAADVNAESGLGGIDLDRDAYLEAVNYIFPDKDDRDDYFEEVSNLGSPEKVPRPMRKTIFFTDLTLEWYEERRAFVSDGDIGIANFGETQINKAMEGVMEVKPGRRFDEWYLYLEPTRDYFYWQYRRNNMQFYTPKREILDLVLQVEAEDRSLERDGDLPNYTYNQTTRGRVMLFLRRHDRE